MILMNSQDLAKKCTQVCLSSPHICNCDLMPGRRIYLTEQEREDYRQRYALGDSNWSEPFEPWVVETWQKHIQAQGLDKKARAFWQRRDRLIQELSKKR
jgi:hypothetical protein